MNSIPVQKIPAKRAKGPWVIEANRLRHGETIVILKLQESQRELSNEPEGPLQDAKIQKAVFNQPNNRRRATSSASVFCLVDLEFGTAFDQLAGTSLWAIAIQPFFASCQTVVM